MQPAQIAPRVLLYPHGAEPPHVDSGWIALAQLPPVPGGPVVFGDGSHPTTRLCAAAVDFFCRQRRPQAVLDVGTGSAVLARIARARGVGCVAATDIDSIALERAKAHADLDAHAVEIQFSAAAPDRWGARFDLVVANILEAPLRVLAPALRRALRPGGVLVVSGFTRPQVPALRMLYEQVGLACDGHSDSDEWTVLTFSSP